MRVNPNKPRTRPGFAMLIGVGLTALQVYLFIVVVPRGQTAGAVGVVLLALIAGAIVAQVYGLVRLWGTPREWVVYPMTFVGLLLSYGMLLPFMLATF